MAIALLLAVWVSALSLSLSLGALWPALLSSLSLLRFVGRRFLSSGGFCGVG